MSGRRRDRRPPGRLRSVVVGFFRLGKGRGEAERALADARAEARRLSGERDELLAALERAHRQAEAAEARARDAEARVGAAEQLARDAAARISDADRLVAAASATSESESSATASPRASGHTVATADGPVDACWPLVLAHLERRWAAGVGATPGTRGVPVGSVSAQLTESLAREVDRLREEVGVDVSFTVKEVAEPSDPVVFLLTAADLLGAMASLCERVTVELDRRLLITGAVWTDLGDELETSRERALAAGAVIDPVEVDDEQVRVALHP